MARMETGVARWILATVVALAVGVSWRQRAASEEFANIDALEGKRIGMVAGALFDEVVRSRFAKPQIFYFTEMPDMTAALINGEIDGIVDDEPVLRHLAANEKRFRLLPGTLQDDFYAFAAKRDRRKLVSAINGELQKMRADGTIAAIVDQWMEGKPSRAADAASADGDVLTLGVFAESPPFVFRSDSGDIVGIDIDLMREVCRRLTYRLVIEAMEFDLLFEAVQEDSVDVIAACISVTEERKKIVSFTTTYYEGGVAAMVLAE